MQRATFSFASLVVLLSFILTSYLLRCQVQLRRQSEMSHQDDGATSSAGWKQQLDFSFSVYKSLFSSSHPREQKLGLLTEEKEHLHFMMGDLKKLVASFPVGISIRWHSSCVYFLSFLLLSVRRETFAKTNSLFSNGSFLACNSVLLFGLKNRESVILSIQIVLRWNCSRDIFPFFFRCSSVDLLFNWGRQLG